MRRLDSSHAADRQHSAVGSECQCLDCFSKCDGPNQPASQRIPKSKFVVLSTRSKPLPVGMKCRARDTAFMSRHENLFVGPCQIPDLNGTRIRSRKMCPVGTKGDI